MHSRFKELEESYGLMHIIPKEKLYLIAELFMEISELIIKTSSLKSGMLSQNTM